MMTPLTEEQKELVTNNHELIFGCAKKMNLKLDEYYDIMAIGLCKAAQSYDASKGKFSTFAYACMKNEVCLYWTHERIKRAIPKNMIVSYDISITNDMDPEGHSTFTDFSDAVADDFSVSETVVGEIIAKEIMSRFNKKEKEIAEYLQNGMTLREIGEKWNCTKQNIGYIVQGMREKCVGYV